LPVPINMMLEGTSLYAASSGGGYLVVSGWEETSDGRCLQRLFRRRLSRLPAPDVVETLSFETLLGQWLTSFQGYCTEAGIDYSAILESDPAYKLLEAGAYREMVLRQKINDAARAVMVAYAQGGDLDQLGALMDVEREILTPPIPTTASTKSTRPMTICAAASCSPRKAIRWQGPTGPISSMPSRPIPRSPTSRSTVPRPGKCWSRCL
jgi:hypothetical protein